MNHSLSQTADLSCPNCGQSFAAEVWLIVDSDERPDLLVRIEEGTLHDTPCPYCNYQGQVDAPLLLYCPNQEPHLFFSPAQATSQEEDLEPVSHLLDVLHSRLGDNWQDEWLQNLNVIPRPVLTTLLVEGPEATLQQMARLANARQEDELPIPSQFIADLLQAQDSKQETISNRVLASSTFGICWGF